METTRTLFQSTASSGPSTGASPESATTWRTTFYGEPKYISKLPQNIVAQKSKITHFCTRVLRCSASSPPPTPIGSTCPAAASPPHPATATRDSGEASAEQGSACCQGISKYPINPIFLFGQCSSCVGNPAALLPNPRRVSSAFHTPSLFDDRFNSIISLAWTKLFTAYSSFRFITVMFILYAQFVDHDITLTPGKLGFNPI